jgi:hypothetical protein
MTPTSLQQEELRKPQLAGSYLNTLGGNIDFNQFSAIEDPMIRSIAITQQMTRNQRAQEMKDLPGAMREVREGQFQDYLRFRPYAFGDLVAGQFVKKLADIPGEVARARQMYGPETVTNFARQTQGFTPRATPRYF